MKNTNISNGDNSINIGKIKNLDIAIDGRNNMTEVEVSNKSELFKLNVSPQRISIIGIIGFLSNIVTILGYLATLKLNSTFIFTILMFGALAFMMLFLVGNTLQRQKFICVFPNMYLQFTNDQISLNKVSIVCPNCKSKMTMVSGERGGARIICKRNPYQHNFEFDYTTI